MVEEYLEKQQNISTFEDFLKEHNRNPLTKAKIIIAKNYDYTYQKSEESILMLIPLGVNDDWVNLDADERDRLVRDGKKMGRNYLYVLPVYNEETKLTEYMLRISRINNLEVSGNRRMYQFDNTKVERTIFEKEISCVSFLAKYFDPNENELLYTAEKSSRSYLVPQRRKYDNGETKMSGGGYIELRHQRIVVGKNRKVYVQILCSWQHYTGEDFQQWVTVASVLYGEFRLLFEFFKFTERYYNVSEYEQFAFQKRYLQGSRNDVSKSIDGLLKRKREREDRKKNNNAKRGCNDSTSFRNMPVMYPASTMCLHGVSDGYEGDCTCENCNHSEDSDC
jgi:hypothetical protein